MLRKLNDHHAGKNLLNHITLLTSLFKLRCASHDVIASHMLVINRFVKQLAVMKMIKEELTRVSLLLVSLSDHKINLNVETSLETAGPLQVILDTGMFLLSNQYALMSRMAVHETSEKIVSCF